MARKLLSVIPKKLDMIMADVNLGEPKKLLMECQSS